jgi:hypothetical protein
MKTVSKIWQQSLPLTDMGQLIVLIYPSECKYLHSFPEIIMGFRPCSPRAQRECYVICCAFIKTKKFWTQQMLRDAVMHPCIPSTQRLRQED